MDASAGGSADVTSTTSAEAAASRALASLCEAAGFDQILSAEVAEASRLDEALNAPSPRGLSSVLSRQDAPETPEVLPAEVLYTKLGGDAALIEPALDGKRCFACLTGRRCGRGRVFFEVATRAAAELLKRAELRPSHKLFTLRVALLECRLQVSSAAESAGVFDLLGQQPVDVAGRSSAEVGTIMRPLTADTVKNIRAILGQRKAAALSPAGNPAPSSGRAGSGHLLLRLEAEWANEIGALTLVSVASITKIENLQRCRAESGGLSPRSRSIPALNGEALEREYAASLRRLRLPLEAFSLRGAPGGCLAPSAAAAGQGCTSLLLLLAPSRAPPDSHFARLARECHRLKEERVSGASDSGDDDGRELSRQARTLCFGEHDCLLPASGFHDNEYFSLGDHCSPRLAGADEGRGASARVYGTGEGGYPHSLRPPGATRAGNHLLSILTRMASSFDMEQWQAQVRAQAPQEKLHSLIGVVSTMQQLSGEALQVARHILGDPRADGRDALQPPVAVAPGMDARAGSPLVLPMHKRQISDLQYREWAHVDECGSDSSPMTRSRSANFASGPLIRGQRGAGASGVPGHMAVSPFVPLRDASPPRSRSAAKHSASGAAAGAGASGGAKFATASPPMATHAAPQRGLVPYASGLSLQPAVLPSFPPPVQVVPSAVSTASMALPSPRQAFQLDDGMRSPVPGGAVVLDRTPNSARGGLVSGGRVRAGADGASPPSAGVASSPSTKQTAGGATASGAAGAGAGAAAGGVQRSRAPNVRLDQASPCRVRYVGGGGASAAAVAGAGSAGADASSSSKFSSAAAAASTGPAPAVAAALPGPASGSMAIAATPAALHAPRVALQGAQLKPVSQLTSPGTAGIVPVQIMGSAPQSGIRMW